MKVIIKEGYKRNDGKYYHNVEINNEHFEAVETLPKFQNCSSRNCKYYRECVYNDGPVRKFDCKKNQDIVAMIYNFFTSILVMIGFFQIYGQYKLGFFKGTAVLIIFLVVLDIICTIIEVSVPKIRDKYFYNKLMKRDKRETEKEKKRREEEEIKKAAEELQKMTQTPYYKNVSEAETFVNSLKEISDDNNFGENDQKIEFCVNRLNEIIELLKKNPSYYNRVAFLFEVYLPEFYNVLKQYTDFMEADCEDEELKQILTKSVDKFLKFLNSQKIETRLGTDKKQAKIQFKATAESLGDMVDRGEEND